MFDLPPGVVDRWGRCCFTVAIALTIGVSLGGSAGVFHGIAAFVEAMDKVEHPEVREAAGVVLVLFGIAWILTVVSVLSFRRP